MEIDKGIAPLNVPIANVAADYSNGINILNTEVADREKQTREFLSMQLPVGAAAGFADTVLQSVGILDKGEMATLISKVDRPLGEYYGKNEAGLRTVGDIGGSLLPVMGATKLARADSVLGAFTKNTFGERAASMLFSTGKPIGELTLQYKERAALLAKYGTKTFAGPTADAELLRLARQAKITTFTDLMKEGIAADAMVYAFMDKSETLYPSDWSTTQNVAFAGALNIGFSGVGSLATNFALKRTLMNDIAPIVDAVTNQSKLPITEALSKPDSRGAAITIRAAMQQTADAERAVAGANNILAENSARMSTTLGNEIKSEIGELGRDNVIEGVTKRYTPSVEEVNTVYHATNKDAGLLFGARSMEEFDIAAPQQILADLEHSNKKLSSSIESMDAEIEKLRKAGGDYSELAKKRDATQIRLDKDKATIAFVVENDGSISTLATRKPVFQDNAKWDRQVIRDAKSDEGITWKVKTGKGPVVGFTTTGHPLVANTERELEVAADSAYKVGYTNLGDEKFTNLDLYHRTALYAAGQKALKHTDVSKLGDLVVTETTHHTRVDWILELIDNPATKDLVLPKIKMPPGRTIEDLQLLSLASKAKEYNMIRDGIDKAAISNLKLPVGQKTNIEDIAKMLNLPGADSGGMHPIMQLFEDIRVAGKPDIPFTKFFKNMNEVNEGMVRLVAPNDLGQELADIKVRGNMFKFAEDRKPVVILHYQKPEGYITYDNIRDKVLAQQTSLNIGLENAAANGAELVGLIYKTLRETPEALAEAKNVGRLVEGTQLSSDRFVQPTFANRENSVIQAQDTLTDVSDKRGREWIKDLMQKHGPTFNRLLNSDNKGHLENLALARNSMGQGWDLKAAPEALANGSYHLVLDEKSAFNKKRWEELYKTQMPEGIVHMPAPLTAKNPTPAPLEITPMAMEGLFSLRELGSTALAQTNYLRHLQGKSQIPFKEWHLPPKNLADKSLVFLVDGKGELNQIVSAHSEKAAHTLAETEIANAAKRGETLLKFDHSDVRAYYNMMDEAAFTRPLNYGSTELQTGRASGKSFGHTVETGPQMLIDMINASTHHLDEIVKRTRGLVFEGEVKYAHALREMSGASEAAKSARATIWDNYINRVYGKPTLNRNTTIGQLYFGIEGAYDQALTHIANYKGAMLGDRSGREMRSSYEAVAKAMGATSPFKDMTDYIEHTYHVATPPSAKRHMAFLNEVTSFATLRVFEVGLAVINYLSLGATMPAVVKAMKRRPDQTVEQWKASISAWGSPVTDDVAMWNPTRAAISGFDFLRSKEWPAVRADAMKRGYLQQEVAESLDTFTAPTQSYLANMLRKGARKLSYLVDKSETGARAISFGTGYKMAREALQLSHEDAMLFAHKFANANIGDYRANNRPQIFQGAAGMSLGLFTTFMWNFLQRVGANMEARQYGALLTQAGMQFSLFGSQSLPGFNQFVEMFNSAYNEHNNLIDGMNARFGHDTTEWFLNGTLSTLPKMFGAETGVAMYSRADINLPFSNGGDIVGQMPSFRLMKEAYGALTNSVKQIAASGFDAHQQSELLQQYSLNRGVQNWIEWYHGYSIDRAGAVINADTNDAMSTLSRVFGFRTSRETDVRTELARGRAAEMAEQQNMIVLRDRLRAGIRDKKSGDELRGLVNDAVREYIKNGGKPENFRRMFQAQVIAATTEKGQLALLEAIKDSHKNNEAVRLLYLQDRHTTE